MAAWMRACAAVAPSLAPAVLARTDAIADSPSLGPFHSIGRELVDVMAAMTIAVSGEN